MTEILLEVKDLRTSFFTDEGEVKAVNGVSFFVPAGKTLGIVGESGSGKSITALSILRLIQTPGKIIGGEILFEGQDLLKMNKNEIREIRGNKISMIFQEPMTSLNPVYTIGDQIGEVFRTHKRISKEEAKRRAIKMLQEVGIPSPERRVDQYPHELSGGMRQRVMIAIALACSPKLLIADEPTTALDVTIQAQILELIKDLQRKRDMSVIMISHDLGVIAETCDYVAVMYCWKVVEFSDVKTLFKAPKHPYTIGLLNSLPRHDIDMDELSAIPGSVPNPFEMPKGCAFAPRCPHAKEICHEKMPSLISINEYNQVRCLMHSEEWQSQNKGVPT